MSGITITGRIERPTAATHSLPTPSSTAPTPAGRTPSSTPCPIVSRAARNLALAHHIERLIERGELRDYAHAAQRLGITRARMTQVMNLFLLPIAEQEDLILGRSARTEHAMRNRGTIRVSRIRSIGTADSN